MKTPFCRLPPRPSRPHDAALSSLMAERAGLIRLYRSRWLGGSKIRWAMKGGSAADRAEVVAAVREWQGHAAGLVLEQVANWKDAEVRIQFTDDGSWSYIGTDCLNIPRNQPTMNFGWPLTDDWGRNTARHEWGHALGFPHEHQNPNAGIVWDEAKVIAALSGPPNNWSEAAIRGNVLDKLSPAEVEGTPWDRNSVMHYPIEAGWIREPAAYRDRALIPDLGLSPQDISQCEKFYPGQTAPPPPKPLVGVLVKGETTWLPDAAPGREYHFTFAARAGQCLRIEMVGNLDTVLVLRDAAGNALKADDDTGFPRNATVSRWSRTGGDYRVDARIVWTGPGTRAGIALT